MRSVLFFGIFDPEYSRNRILMKGFRENGWSVDMCRVDPRRVKGIGKYVALWRAGKEAKRHGAHDLVIAAFPGQTVAWMARLIFGRGIVFDAFLSLYDSNVHDRKMYSRLDPRAWKDFFFDWLAAAVSSRTLLDTYEHIAYYSKTFFIPHRSFVRVLIGADDSIFMPSYSNESSQESPTCSIEFHGMFIPLQGVPTIIEAAALLKNERDITFTLYGNGQTFKACTELATKHGLTNIRFAGQIPMTELPAKIAPADICLGIFGSTEKAQRVIPNKVYECAAMGKAVISADSPAMREVFTGTKDVIFSRSSDLKDLAEKILILKRDPVLRTQVAREARKTFVSTCSPKVIVGQLIHDLHL